MHALVIIYTALEVCGLIRPNNSKGGWIKFIKKVT